MLREWAESEIFYSLYAQCVLVNVSTCNYIILRSLIFRRVISVHYLLSMPIRVPQCLKFKFSTVKCVYLLSWHNFRLLFHWLLPHSGIYSSFLKNGTSIVFTFPSISAYLVCPANLFHFSSSKLDSNRLLYSSVSHETNKYAKLRSVWSENHVLQIQLCRIRFY